MVPLGAVDGDCQVWGYEQSSLVLLGRIRGLSGIDDDWEVQNLSSLLDKIRMELFPWASSRLIS